MIIKVDSPDLLKLRREINGLIKQVGPVEAEIAREYLMRIGEYSLTEPQMAWVELLALKGFLIKYRKNT